MHYLLIFIFFSSVFVQCDNTGMYMNCLALSHVCLALNSSVFASCKLETESCPIFQEREFN